MPKLKTHSGASKRFKITKNGKVKRAHAFTGHDIQGRKNMKKKRSLRKAAYCGASNERNMKVLLPYK